MYTPLTIAEYFNCYHLYLAKENGIGMIVSVKEVSLKDVDHISEELLVYKDLEEHGSFGKIEGIL